MNKVVVTIPMIGICFMQVCAEADATDAEILAVCNSENPAGTMNGWGKVWRTAEEEEDENKLPVDCGDNKLDGLKRKHFLVSC